MRKQRLTVLAVVAGLILAQPVGAQQRSVVALAKGASAATLTGSIKGNQDHGYLVDARAGQALTVDIEPSNASACFNVTAPGADAAPFIGSASGKRFSGTLTASGPLIVQVYSMRNPARRDETANYIRSIGVTGAAAAAGRLPPGPYRCRGVP